MDSKRILITGISRYWGGRLAQALEAFPEVEAVIGVDNEEPQVELERTEYVKVGAQHALLRRVVEAAEIDTVVDTRLVVDSATTSSSKAHENNVMGTMNILAACTGSDSPVRKVVFKSSTHFYGSQQDDPAFFDETMRRPHPPRTGIERDIVEAEASLDEFAERHPETAVTVLRFANVLGPDVETSHIRLFSLPAVPMILGFDPRYQFVHEDDVVHALEHAVAHRVPGTYNVAGDGVLALSEVAGLLGKPYAPVLPPWGTGLATSVLKRIGLNIPPENLNQMRFGRGVDNRRYKAAGFRYQHTSREAVHQARRAPAPPSGGARRAGAVPLRARGGGLPALEPAREEHARQGCLRAQSRAAGRAPAAPDELRRHRRNGPVRRPGRPGGGGRAAGRRSGGVGARGRRPRRAGRRAGGEARPRSGRARACRRARSSTTTTSPPRRSSRCSPRWSTTTSRTLREYERDHANRTRVIGAIESVLARRGSAV